MYLALIFLIVVAILASVLIGKVLKTALSIVRGEGKDKQDKAPDGAKQSEKEEQKRQKEEKSESKTQSESTAEPKTAFSEEQTNRYAEARRSGISEVFWTEPTVVSLDGKRFADKCVENSNLTYLEVNNRNLAGEEFQGFNILIEENEKMTLTYQGQAIATLTRTVKAEKKTVDGKEIIETTSIYRTNTFPPKLTPGMVPADLEKMFSAREDIRACQGNPELVASQMQMIFSDYDNVGQLKENIVPKIQAKESKGNKLSAETTKPIRNVSILKQ